MIQVLTVLQNKRLYSELSGEDFDVESRKEIRVMIINSQRIKPYTFAIRYSQHTSQKLQKSMSLPTLIDNLNGKKYDNTTKVCINNSGLSDKTNKMYHL